MDLKRVLGLVVNLASPETLSAVKAVLGTLSRLGRLKGDDGHDVTPEQLSVLWAEARVEFKTLGDEAAASNAAIKAAGGGE